MRAASSAAPPPAAANNRRRPAELLAEAAASAPPLSSSSAPRRDAAFYASRAAALEALVPGLVDRGGLHALPPREAAALLADGVGERGATGAARLVRLRSAVPRGVDVGELVQRYPRLLMPLDAGLCREEVEEEEEKEQQQQSGGSGGSGGPERVMVARLRRLLGDDDDALADLLRAHPELLIPSVGGRRAIAAKLALLERGLAQRRARGGGAGRGDGDGDNDGDADDADADPTRSAAALVAACPALLARSEAELAAVLAELADVDAALGASDDAAAARRLHGRALAARPALLHHYGRGARAGRGGGVVREAVEDAPALLELPSAGVFRELLRQRPGTLLEALLPPPPPLLYRRQRRGRGFPEKLSH